MRSVAAREGSRLGGLRYVAERRGVLATLLISPSVLFIGALVGAPLVLAVYLSFTDATAGSLTGPWVGLRNFRDAVDNPVFRSALWHTFVFTLISQAVVVVCAGLLAHALVRNFRGRFILRFFILLPWAAPIALTAIGFLWFYDPQASIFNWFLIHLHIVSAQHVPNWLGTPREAMSSIITVQAWRTIPFATVIFLAGISSIPQEVDDAAAIDGATGLRKFWYVSLPLQLPIAEVGVAGVRPDEDVELPPNARELGLPAPSHRLPALAEELVLRRSDGRPDNAGGRDAGGVRARQARGPGRSKPRRRHLPHISRP